MTDQPASPSPQPASSKKIPPVMNPTVDLSVLLSTIIGETGNTQDVAGGFRIAVMHTTSFPWDEIFKELLYRDFKVAVTRHKADLFIEAIL